MKRWGPLAEDTAIVFWTDHGWHLGEKEHWRKFALWEEATRTPVIISAPGITEAKTQCDQPISLLDLYPTVLELTGLPSKEDLEGNSLVPLLKDPSAEWPHLAITTHGRHHHAVRDRRWRYIRYADESEELYDHADDPGEHVNRASDPALEEVKARLASRLPKVNVEDSPRKERN